VIDERITNKCSHFKQVYLCFYFIFVLNTIMFDVLYWLIKIFFLTKLNNNCNETDYVYLTDY